jgi:polyisoprenoid-binding protein YceI
MKISPIGYLTALLLIAMILFSFIPRTEIISYPVDASKSTMVWTAHKVVGFHTGNVKIISGELKMEDRKIIGGTFEIDLASLTVTDITDPASNTRLTNHLKNDDFFSVEKFPSATFKITSSRLTTGNEHIVMGDLTIKGITNTLEFPATVTKSGDVVTAKARITVDRTKYDIKFRSSNFFENLGDRAIYDEFTLDLSLVTAASRALADN